MVGIQAMTRSISQFLNRHSQSLAQLGQVMLHQAASHTQTAVPLQIKHHKKAFESKPEHRKKV